MSIEITRGSESAKIQGKTEEVRTPEQAINSLLKVGKVLSARILAQNGNDALLKLSDLLLSVKTEGISNLKNENVLLRVINTSPEKTLMEIIPNDKKVESFLPEVKVNFTISESSLDTLNKISIKSGDSLPLKITETGENVIKVQIGEETIELKSELNSLKGENIKVRLDTSQKEVPRLILIENGSPVIKSDSIIKGTQENVKNLVFKEENMQLLNKMVTEGKTQITLAKSEELTNSILKFSLNENEKNLNTLKNMTFESSNLRDGQYKNQEILTITKLEFNNKTQMAEGLLKDEKLLLKPILEFKDNTILTLKYSIENNKAVFTVDTIVTKENEKIMNQLALKLGEFILEEKELPEIVKSIIDNKMPLTKENIKIVQNFINFFPGDAKTGMDMLLNQNLLMGLYYQLNNLNDKFLIKGYQKKKGKREGREKSYDFSILYESEKLGDILVDLEWTEFLKLDFYCEEMDTVDLIESSLEDLKENLKIKNITINVEHNQEKTKKIPIKAEKISLTNIDISI